MRVVVLLAIAVLGCGSPQPAPKRGEPERVDSPFVAARDFEPVAFGVDVSGEGRPIIFIPGLGCPGEVWDDVVEHLGDEYESHVLTLSGFAGRDPIDEPLSLAVRRDLTRYIRSRKLKDPVIVGHSMGGFIAYWIASYHPELVGAVVIVDASPALSGGMEEAKVLRERWKNASDDELERLVRIAFMSMTKKPRKMAPIIEKILKSDRRTLGEAIYEMVLTDLRAEVDDIQAPVLIVAADGGLQKRIREQTASIPDHEMVVIPRTKHFVMWDEPEAFFRVLDRFLERSNASEDP